MKAFDVQMSRVFAAWTADAERDGMAEPRIAALSALLAAFTDPLGVTEDELRIAMRVVRGYRKRNRGRLTRED